MKFKTSSEVELMETIKRKALTFDIKRFKTSSEVELMETPWVRMRVTFFKFKTSSEVELMETTVTFLAGGVGSSVQNFFGS